MGGMGSQSYTSSVYEPTAEDERLAELALESACRTEDVWTREFRRQGWGEYECPEMVLYTGEVNSACGHATSQVGPFLLLGRPHCLHRPRLFRTWNQA